MMTFPWTKLYYRRLVIGAYRQPDGAAHRKIQALFDRWIGLPHVSTRVDRDREAIHQIIKACRHHAVHAPPRSLGHRPIGIGELCIECLSSDSNSALVYLFGKSDNLPFFEVYRQHVKTDDVVIDVGTNIGMHSLALSHLVGASGQVHAFEPSAPLAQRARANFAFNDAGNIVLHEQAVGEAAGEVGFNDLSDQVNIGKSHLDPAAPLKVKLVTLDGLIPEQAPVSLLKIDVEGAELGVLRGARRLLTARRPVVVMEANLTHYSLKEIQGAFPYPVTLATLPYQLHERSVEITAEAGIRDGKTLDLVITPAP